MSLQEENKLLKMLIKTQASCIEEQEQTIKELHSVIDELRSVKANLEETLSEFKRQFFGVCSEKTSSFQKEDVSELTEKKKIQIKAHTRERKPKAKREDFQSGRLSAKCRKTSVSVIGVILRWFYYKRLLSEKNYVSHQQKWNVSDICRKY